VSLPSEISLEIAARTHRVSFSTLKRFSRDNSKQTNFFVFYESAVEVKG